MKKELKIYFAILALGALGAGLSGNVLSNYFKDVYDVTTAQRGFIEFPRELPGMLSILVVSALSFMTDYRIAVIAQILAAIGIAVLGFFTPIYSIMLVFIFINSFGAHLFMPMRQSIGISLIDDHQDGKRMGQYNGVMTAFRMVGALLVFIGFRLGFFSFKTPIKMVFVIAAIFLLLSSLLLYVLGKMMHNPDGHHTPNKFVFKMKYKYYYMLVVMFGVQKQIMLVYAPWVLIELLNVKVDTLAILSIIGGFIGIFFIPAVGRWIDQFGVKKLLYADALSFIGVYALFGVLSAGYVSGSLATVGLPMFLGFALFIIDKMSTQLGLVRTVFLKRIVDTPADITPTLSLGLSLDHLVSIIAAILGGVVWYNWGPQYIFYGVSSLSLINLYVASKAQID